MSHNTPTLGENDLTSPDIVRFISHPDTRAKIDQRLFPIQKQTIDDMPHYLETVNSIIGRGSLNEITLHELSLIQAFIRGNNNPEEIIQIEKEYSLNLVVWLHFYLEVTHSEKRQQEYQDFMNQATNPLDTKEEERIWELLKERMKTHNRAKEILEKYRIQ